VILTAREIMKRLSKLRNDQLDLELIVYFRDLDRYFEVSSFEIMKNNELYDEDQPYLVV